MRALSLFSALIICASWVPCATLVSRVASSKAGRTTGRRALFPRGDHGEEDLVTLTEQHSPELLLKHGALQRHGAGSAESDQMQPLTLALRGQTGDLIAAASTEKLQEAKVLCTLPKRLRSKPLKALAVAHSLIYSLDLLEHLAEVTRQAGVDMLGDRATLGEVVVVGFTALSRCLIPVLSELGFEVNVVVPSESDAKVARSLGATATLLRDEEAFSDAFPDAVAYVDAIGRQHTRYVQSFCWASTVHGLHETRPKKRDQETLTLRWARRLPLRCLALPRAARCPTSSEVGISAWSRSASTRPSALVP